MTKACTKPSADASSHTSCSVAVNAIRTIVTAIFRAWQGGLRARLETLLALAAAQHSQLLAHEEARTRALARREGARGASCREEHGGGDLEEPGARTRGGGPRPATAAALRRFEQVRCRALCRAVAACWARGSFVGESRPRG